MDPCNPDQGSDLTPQTSSTVSQMEVNGPSFEHDHVYGRDQRPQDLIDEALMESFPCSDPPSYSCGHI